MLNTQRQPDANYAAAPAAYSLRLTRTSDDISAAKVVATSEDASRRSLGATWKLPPCR